MVYLSGRRSPMSLTWSFLRKEAASTTLNDSCKLLMSLQSDLLLVVAAIVPAADHHHRQGLKSRKHKTPRNQTIRMVDMAIYIFCLRAILKTYRWHKLIKGVLKHVAFNSFTAFCLSHVEQRPFICCPTLDAILSLVIILFLNKIMSASSMDDDGNILQNEASRSFNFSMSSSILCNPQFINFLTHFWNWIWSFFSTHI